MHPFAIALLEAGEYQKGRVELTGVNHVIKTIAPFLQSGDVGRFKIAVLSVQSVQVMVKNLYREFFVDRPPTVVVLLEVAGDARRQQLLARGGANRPIRQQRAGGRRAGGTGGRKQQAAGPRQGKRA